MPWMRRFGIAPTGTIGQAQRQMGAWVYAGILAEAPVVETDPGSGWVAPIRPTLLTCPPRRVLLTAPNRSTLWTAPDIR